MISPSEINCIASSVHVNGQLIERPIEVKWVFEYENINTFSDSKKVPDPDWHFVDKAGHFHTYNQDLETPTLEVKISDSYWCDGCQDQHEDTIKQCLICKQKIVPKLITEPYEAGAFLRNRSTELSVPGFFNGENSVRVIVNNEEMTVEWFGNMRAASFTEDADSQNWTKLVGFLHNRFQSKPVV